MAVAVSRKPKVDPVEAAKSWAKSAREVGEHPDYIRTWRPIIEVSGMLERALARHRVDWVLIVTPRGRFDHASATTDSFDPRGITAWIHELAREWRREAEALAAERDEEVPPPPPPVVPVRQAGSFLYLLERTGLVKIGKSDNPRARAAALSHACGETVSVVAAIGYATGAAALRAESIAHERFAAHRRRGEWFTDVPEIRDYFAGLVSR